MYAIVTTIAEHTFFLHIFICLLTVAAIIARFIKVPKLAGKYREVAITGILVAVAIASLIAAVSPRYEHLLYRGVATLPPSLDTHNGLPNGTPNPDVISSESDYSWVTADFFPEPQRVAANQKTLAMQGCSNAGEKGLRYFYVGPDRLLSVYPGDGLNARAVFPEVASYSDKGVTYYVHAGSYRWLCEFFDDVPLRVVTTP